MKRYLNKNLFYQGDGNIFIPLCIVYLSSFILNLILNDLYFSWEIYRYLYNQSEVRFIISYEHVVLLILYIGIVYIITIGMFKKKKWSTFLAGPFSRIDIRKRELLIIIISVIIHILIFLVVLFKDLIQYYDVIVYINDFYKIILLDIIRIFSISTIIIGVLSVLDSIFSNTYYLIMSVVISFVY